MGHIMRRPWIKIETCTPDKPEICSLSTQLRIDEDTVMGKLVRLWAWAELNRVDPNDLGVTKEFIDRLVGRKGFSLALESTGWLVDTDGKLSFRNFKRHNSPVAQNKALTAKRVARHRLRKAATNEKKTATTLENNEPLPATVEENVVIYENVKKVKTKGIKLVTSEESSISDEKIAAKDETVPAEPFSNEQTPPAVPETATVAPEAPSSVHEAPPAVHEPAPVISEVPPVTPEAAPATPDPAPAEEVLTLEAEEPSPRKRRAKASPAVEDQPMLF